MLRLIAYDISDARRLHRIATTCEDYGVRIQKSLFECWLDEERFRELWALLGTQIDPAADRLVAYTLDAAAVRRRQAAGAMMACTEARPLFIL